MHTLPTLLCNSLISNKLVGVCNDVGRISAYIRRTMLFLLMGNAPLWGLRQYPASLIVPPYGTFGLVGFSSMSHPMGLLLWAVQRLKRFNALVPLCCSAYTSYTPAYTIYISVNQISIVWCRQCMQILNLFFYNTIIPGSKQMKPGMKGLGK